MKSKHHIVKTASPPDNAKLLRSHYSSVFMDHIELPAVMLAVAVLLSTGCSSTGHRFNARLISPMPTNQQAWSSEDDRWYQPSRSPAFSDFLGG